MEKKEIIKQLLQSTEYLKEVIVKGWVRSKRDSSSTHIVKNGTRNGHHKYICRDCKKNFTYRTNTILSGIQKLNKWNMFVEDFMSLNITPIRQLKTQLGVEILNPTKDYTEELLQLALNLLRTHSVAYKKQFDVNKDATRGLDYYVGGKGFEISFDELGACKQICGGGSYDGGVGFAIGIDRLLLLK